MIFNFQCSLGELDQVDRHELEDVFSKLIDADRSGRHYFIARRELCDWVREKLSLSGRDSSHLLSIRERYAVRGGLVETSSAHVRVVIGDAPISVSEPGTFLIGHKPLMEGEYLLRKTGLVVEDVDTDGKLYGHILNEARKISGIPSFSMDAIHGGGNRIDMVFDREISSRRIVVCVTDHDKLAPDDRKSPAARRVERNCIRRNFGIGSRAECFVGLGVVTVGRELENHIPYHLFKVMDAFGNYPHFQRLDEIVSQNGRISPEECYWQYFDIKRGMDGRRIREKFNNGELSESVLDWICEKIGCEPDTIEHNCIDGFGNGVVNAFFSSPDALGGFHDFVRSEYWRFVFGDYFKKLLWFFAAPSVARL